MSYEKLNLQKGDVLTDEVILHLEQGIKDIEDKQIDLKEKLIKTLKEKNVTLNGSESISDLILKISELRDAEHITYDHGDLIDITDCIESGTIRLLVKDVNIQFAVAVSDATNGEWVIDWGDGYNNSYTGNKVVNHTYSKGTGTACTEGYTQFMITIKPVNCNIIRFFNNINSSSYMQNLLWFASKDVFFATCDSMVLQATNLLYIDIIGGSLGTEDMEFSMKMFASGCTSLKYVNGNFYAANCISMDSAFSNCNSLGTINLGDYLDLGKCQSFNGTFYQCAKLKELPKMNMSTSTTFRSAFQGCRLIKSFNTDELDIRSATNIVNMCTDCTSLEELPVTLHFEAVQSADNAFWSCSSLHIIPDTIHLPVVTSANQLFASCTSLIYAPILDVPNLVGANSMFNTCTSLKSSPDLDLPLVTSMNGLFQRCSSLEKTPKINAPKVTSCNNVYDGCNSLKETVEYSFPNGTNFNSFYKGCINLSEIKKITTTKQVTLDNFAAIGYGGLLKKVNMIDCESSSTYTSCFNGDSSLTTIVGVINFEYSANNGSSSYPMFYGVSQLTGTVYFKNLHCTNLSLEGNKKLDAIVITNIYDDVGSMYFRNNNFNTTVINNIFKELPTTTTAKTIYVSGNPGYSTCDKTIATNKGWSVA